MFILVTDKSPTNMNKEHVYTHSPAITDWGGGGGEGETFAMAKKVTASALNLINFILVHTLMFRRE